MKKNNNMKKLLDLITGKTCIMVMYGDPIRSETRSMYGVKPTVIIDRIKKEKISTNNAPIDI